MADLAKQEGSSVLVMGKSFGGIGPALPFTTEILLLETRVAGAAHYEAEKARDGLAKGVALRLRRQPSNEKDALAIEVLTSANEKLGYVPRAENTVLARLMDAGKFLTAYVEDLEPMGRWTAIDIRIAMKNV